MNRLLLAGLCLLVATSCTKKPALKEEEEGPEASAEEVQKAVVKAWGNVDPLTIRKNEFVYLESTQKVQDLTPQTFLQEGITVLERTLSDDGSEYLYTLAHQTREVGNTDGESKSSTVEEHISIPNTGNISMNSMSLQTLLATQAATGDEKIHPMNLGVQTVYSMLMACVKSPDRDVSCHNLQYSEELQDAPPLVKAQPNCGGLKDCKITVRHLAFDYIFTDVNEETKTTEKTKIQFSMSISPDVPYLSRLMTYCYRGLYFIKSAGQKVLLQVCSNVKNFEAGTLPTP